MAAHALLLDRVGHDLVASASLSLGSYNVLRLLHEAPDGRLRLSELARVVHLTRSGVTRMANRLEKVGLLRREQHPRDRRGSWAVLTERGRDELTRVRRVFVRAVAEHFGSYLSDGDAETLNAILSRMVKAETGAE
jgi:DNA-binding MarR family transcriptional regulator